MSVKRNIFIVLLIFLITISVKAENHIKKIFEGYVDAPIKILAFESLTCPACANFHKNIYPELKKDFIDTGLIKIEFRNFPLDIMALNAAKIVFSAIIFDFDFALGIFLSFYLRLTFLYQRILF